MEKMEKQSQQKQLKSFISGAIGGFSLVFAAHPFDLIKVRMQTIQSNGSTFSAAKNIVIQDGFKGLYRGVTPVLTGTPPILAVNFWAYHVCQMFVYETMVGKTFRSVSDLNLFQIGVAGSLAAIPSALLMAPAEQIKIRLQTSANKALNSTQVIKTILKDSGPLGLFRGTFLTIARDVPGSFMYFLTYEAIKRQTKDTVPTIGILFGGGIAGMLNWTIAIPCDTLKSRIQSSPNQRFWTVFQTLIKQDGISGLFRGLRPTLVRAFPASAAFFFGVEVSNSFMDKYF
jgi:solute carrier family 25 carnitine/acylcarnitine transporter 20/29